MPLRRLVFGATPAVTETCYYVPGMSSEGSWMRDLRAGAAQTVVWPKESETEQPRMMFNVAVLHDRDSPSNDE